MYQEDVRKKVFLDIFVYAPMINVEVNNNKVILSGTVPSAIEKYRAIEDVKLEGLEAVNAEALTVKWIPKSIQRKAETMEQGITIAAINPNC